MNSTFDNNMELLNESTLLLLADIYMSFLDTSLNHSV